MVVGHSKAIGIVEVFDLIVPTFYRVSQKISLKLNLEPEGQSDFVYNKLFFYLLILIKFYILLLFIIIYFI